MLSPLAMQTGQPSMRTTRTLRKNMKPHASIPLTIALLAQALLVSLEFVSIKIPPLSFSGINHHCLYENTPLLMTHSLRICPSTQLVVEFESNHCSKTEGPSGLHHEKQLHISLLPSFVGTIHLF